MNNSVPLISVVIPCYNDDQYITEAVNSIFLQNYENIECVIVDDGSDQQTKQILERLCNQVKITLIHQENKGQSSARNVGIAAANGEYIFVLDSDDYLLGEFFKKATQILELKPEVKLVTCLANLVYEDGSTELYKPKGGVLKDFLLQNNALGTSFFRKNDWKIAGGYDETMRGGFEDWEYFIRLLSNDGHCEVIPEIGYAYRKRRNTTTEKANSKKYELFKYIYTKNETLFKNNFEYFISFMLGKIEDEEIKKNNARTSIDYKIGYNLLRPLRFIKKIFSGK